MNQADSAHKINQGHLARKAVVYLRQSSMAQVKHNQESQRLQYALSDAARQYGFKHVEVIDCDLGMSASPGAPVRTGFKQLLASVAVGEVGIVLSRELSRLSRTDKDWCHLIELCQVCNTLIGDAENIYDLNRLDDQLILGIKGTLSVVELQTFSDYCPITSMNMPQIAHANIESPSPFTFNGAKGMGESAGAPLDAISGAIEDAVYSEGSIVTDSHHSPPAIYRMLGDGPNCDQLVSRKSR